MPALEDIIQQRLAALNARHLRRVPQPAVRGPGARVKRAGRELVSFGCNDYLGLSRHPRVIAAAQDATGRYGAGAGASRLITGEHPLYAELESRLARWHEAPAACVFGSGYLANLGAITALIGGDDLIVADKLAHACMIDGARLSGARFRRFAHNDTAHLARLLERERASYANCLIVSEAVFSMDGDRAPVAELAALAERYDAWLLIDAAHDVHAPASAAPRREWAQGHVLIGTLSKALGAYGGYVCGSQALIDYLKTSARALMFTTGLPPGVLAAAAEALDILAESPALCARPLSHARLFTRRLGMPEAHSAIVPVMIGEAAAALALSEALAADGILASAIRPPTVPPGTARLRFAFSAAHAQADIRRAADVLAARMPDAFGPRAVSPSPALRERRPLPAGES